MQRVPEVFTGNADGESERRIADLERLVGRHPRLCAEQLLL